jgi:hypothetical protein
MNALEDNNPREPLRVMRELRARVGDVLEGGPRWIAPHEAVALYGANPWRERRRVRMSRQVRPLAPWVGPGEQASNPTSSHRGGAKP